MKRIAFVLSSFLFVALAHAASFDCNKAATQVEKMICGDPGLSNLDEDMGTAYRDALKDKRHAAATRLLQRQWLDDRNECTDADCLRKGYRLQLRLLRLPVVTVQAGRPIAFRSHPSATLLSSGKVLIAGGSNGSDEEDDSFLSSAELYDPATNRFTATGDRTAGGANVTARLQDGKVLLVGDESADYIGGHGNIDICDGPAELYDPSTGRFTFMDNISNDYPACPVAATPLKNGKVLIEDRNGSPIASNHGSYLRLYDPVKGKILPIGKLAVPGEKARPDPDDDEWTATLLHDGTVLFVGTANAIIFDPQTNSMTATGKLNTPRSGFTSTLLADGRVLVAGGIGDPNPNGMATSVSSAELYDPATGRFTPAGNLDFPRAGQSAVLLRNGMVLISGGRDGDSSLASIELYDPDTGKFKASGRLAEPGEHTATLLQDGRVLFVGGSDAEIYDPAANPPKLHSD